MISPCIPWISLKRGVQTVAVINLLSAIVTGFYGLVILAIDLQTKPLLILNGSNFNSSSSNATDKVNPFTDIVKNHHREMLEYLTHSFVGGFVMCCELWLGWILWKGASKESRPKLNRWWWITVLILATSVIISLVTIFLEGETTLGVIQGVELTLGIYALWLVTAFIRQIPKDKNRGGGSDDQENLTEFGEIEGMSHLHL